MQETLSVLDAGPDWEHQLRREVLRVEHLMRTVIPIGVTLAHETDFNRLLERILIDAMGVCNADGGTLYLCTERDTLEYSIMRTTSLGIALGGTTRLPIPHPPIPLSDPCTGAPNHSRVAAHAALTGTTVNVHDVYNANEFDFSGPKTFDKATGYRTKSMLAIPLRDNHGRVIGIVQLVNARSPGSETPSPFEVGIQEVIECLCLLAGAALTFYLRQQKLKDEVQQLKIEIDQSKRDRQVAQIADSDYFKQLKERARELQQRVRGQV